MAALLGLEIVLHRRYLQELNGLLSTISILQSERDLTGVEDPARRTENVAYLESYADLLGLVSAVAGYYTQGNAVLAFNGMSGAVHSRANLLKLNIQMKLLHGARP